jgi:hypothetical protein
MLQLHFPVGVVVRSRRAVKVIRVQWQLPVYSLGGMVFFLSFFIRWAVGLGVVYHFWFLFRGSSGPGVLGWVLDLRVIDCCYKIEFM